MKIEKATINQINDLIPLFDAYRKFYKQKSNLEGAKEFLSKRLEQKDSVIFIAYSDNTPVGFTQLYNLFSSVSMQPIYLLNDLFVTNAHRGKGIGETLINKAKELCFFENKKGLAIQTAKDNPAQELYKRMGFMADTDLQFFWTKK